MKVQDYIVAQTREAGAQFSAICGFPKDKLKFVVAEGTRTSIHIAQKVAACSIWASESIANKTLEWSEEIAEAEQAQTNIFDTIDKCEAEFNKNMESFAAAVSGISDGELAETVWLPFIGGKAFELVELAGFPMWNLNYHTGQVAMVQLALGDRQMY